MENKKLEDEINYKNVAKNPMRWFGLVYPYFVVVIVILGVFYVKNIDRVNYNSLPPKIIEKMKFEDIAVKKGGFVPAVDLMSVGKPTDELIAKGKDLYKGNCESCHGVDGFGDGTAGAALNPKPRNFHEKDGWTNGRSVSDLFKTLKEGIIANGMAAYEYLPVEDRFALIHYVQTFADDYPQVTDEELAALDKKYNLSADVYIPNEIPVAKSIKLLSKENKLELASLIVKIENLDSDNKNFLKSLSFNPVSTISSLRKELLADKTQFIKAVSLSPTSYELKNSVLNLNDTEWSRLYNLVKSL